jgi:hypothetical protein
MRVLSFPWHCLFSTIWACIMYLTNYWELIGEQININWTNSAVFIGWHICLNNYTNTSKDASSPYKKSLIFTYLDLILIQSKTVYSFSYTLLCYALGHYVLFFGLHYNLNRSGLEMSLSFRNSGFLGQYIVRKRNKESHSSFHCSQCFSRSLTKNGCSVIIW